MTWKTGDIEGVVVEPLKRFSDERGWLSELFRLDELGTEVYPAMGYASETGPGVTRGPHEHVDQTDYFVFLSGSVSLYLWDDRENSATYGVRSIFRVGTDNPVTAMVPPGVVHAYRNDGDAPVLILNFPNRLYAGPNRSEPVDEIRHEERTDTRFGFE
jgi:dTDP-4-dehydrorhamnose 3,5-epimerase